MKCQVSSDKVVSAVHLLYFRRQNCLLFRFVATDDVKPSLCICLGLSSNRPVHNWILQGTIFVTEKFRKAEEAVVFIKVWIHILGRRRKRRRYRFQIICRLLYGCGNVLNVVVQNAVLILISFILTYGYTLLQSCSHNYI